MDRSSGSPGRWECVDFELEILEGGPRDYTVVVRSPEGEAQEQMRFPFDQWELKDKLRDIEVALLRSGGSRRALGTPEERSVQEFGRALFEALLARDVGAHYRVSLREARRQNKGLRLKLRIQPSELSVLPWEFLYDPSDDYLCLSTTTPLVRYLNLPLPVEQLAVTPPLRILGMVASPQGLPQLDVGHEKRLMEEAIKGPRAEGLVELAWLQGQTWRDLQRAMRHGPWHVFHFIGHGGFDLETEEGAIALSDEEGRNNLLDATHLARLLDDHYFLRLVFLNSCEGAKGSERDAFSSTAATLVRCGVPAVVAMQYEVTDGAAIEFSRNFYEAVADGLPMDAAVAEARTGVNMVSALEWGIPVLYMRSPDGRIFDVQQARDREEERRKRLEGLYAQAQRAYQTRDWRAVVDVFAQIHSIDPQYPDSERLLGSAQQALAALKLASLYDQGLRHMEIEEWSKALEFFEEIQRLEPGYQDTERLLSQARQEEERRKQLDELEAEAHRLHRDREWQQVVDTFDQIRALDSEHPDPEGLLNSAREALERAQKEQDALHRYHESVESAWAVEGLDRGEAERLRELKNRLELDPSAAAAIEREVMGDALEVILERQEARDREEDKRQRQLSVLYARARRSHKAQEWQAVVDLFEQQIHALDPAYPDPEGLLASAREEELAALERVRRVSAVYDQGRQHMEAEEWSQALECFEEVQRLKPGHQETDRLLSRVRREVEKSSTIEVPKLSGRRADQAKSILENKGLELGNQNETPSATIPEGEIIRQNPKAKAEVEPGSLVSITVSSGPQKTQPETPATVQVPDLVGQMPFQARSMLADASLALGSQTETPSDSVLEGRIVKQDPAAGTKAKQGSPVSIMVSSGPQEVRIGRRRRSFPPTRRILVIVLILLLAFASLLLIVNRAWEKSASLDENTQDNYSASDQSAGDWRAAAQAVEDFYASAVEGDYETASTLLSASRRQSISLSRATFDEQFLEPNYGPAGPATKEWQRAASQSIKFIEGPTAEVSGNTATVTGTIEVEHTNDSDSPTEWKKSRTWKRGTWTLVNEGGQWKLDDWVIKFAGKPSD